MLKAFKIILLILFIAAGCKEDSLVWQYKSLVFQGIIPVVRGDMVVTGDQFIYIFDPRAPVNIEFAHYELPPDDQLSSFNPPLKEEWMNDAGERLNRETVRLFRSGVYASPSLLFREYGQNGYWWISQDNQTIYILVQWFDHTKDIREPAHLTFWKSVNAGKDFIKIKWTNPQLGRGKAAGMYFDSKGINGYIFVNKNTLLQTQDGGETWQKVSIPYSEATPLRSRRIAVDSVTVDQQGNLLFALFKEGNSFIYQIPAINKETDLSQLAAKYQIPNKRLLSINSIPDQTGLYLFYINCEGKDCRWFDSFEVDQQGKQNQPLRFTSFIEGKYTNDQSLGFFLPIKKVYMGEQGKIAVTLEMPNKRYYNLLLSDNYGKTWLLKDLEKTRVVSDYIDFKNNQYWQYRVFNKLYMTDNLFK